MGTGTPYTVWHAMGSASLIEGGVKVSATQQRVALDAAGVTYVTGRPDDYDILHLNFPGPHSLAALAHAKATGRPVVIHAHSVGENLAGTYRFSNAVAPAFRAYFKWFFRRADVVIAVSPYMRDRLAANGIGGDGGVDVEVVSNGVDGDALDGFDRLAGVNEKYDAESPVVVNLAQVYDLKGVPEFVAAGEALPDLDFRWFGPRHRYLAPSRTRRTVASAPGNVRFPGFVEDKREAFALGDVFFAPTRRETQGMTILEALYCGLPIVTRDIPVFDGWLEDGVHCLKGSDVPEFVDAIARLRDEPDLRARLGGNARELAREHTLETVGRDLKAIYDGLV